MFPAEPFPDKIGTYKVIRHLSGTGTVETFLARSQGPMGFQRNCVLKLMSDTSEGSVRFAEELAREAAICARLTHPNIVRMFDFFEHDKKLVLVLEYVESVSLSELLLHLAEKRQKLSDPVIYHIGHQLAGALAHAHTATDEKGKSTPIIHRNLHPDNILLAMDGQVRLTGFGVGKILGRTPDTAIGTIKGRPGYMAPEQARGEPGTTKADVYGLGLLLWSLFTGRQPPADGTFPARIGTFRGDLPREISAMIDAALDRFPGTRKIGAREMDQWLAKIVPTEKGKTELRGLLTAYREEHPIAEDDSPDRASSTAIAPAANNSPPSASPASAQPPVTQNPLSALLHSSADQDPTTRMKVSPAPERDKSAQLKPPLRTPERDTLTQINAPLPLPPPAMPQGAPSAIRFGEPPPGLPPPPPLPVAARKKDDWRTALPDVDNIDQIFEATTSEPPADNARGPTPAPAPVAPVAPVAPAAPTAPAAATAPAAPAVPPAPPAPRPPSASAIPAPPRLPSASSIPVPPRLPSASSIPAPPRLPSASSIPAPPRPVQRPSAPGIPAPSAPIPKPPAVAASPGAPPAPPRGSSRSSVPGIPATLAPSPKPPVVSAIPSPPPPAPSAESNAPLPIHGVPAAPIAITPTSSPVGSPATPFTFGAPPGAASVIKVPSAPPLELAPDEVEEPVRVDSNRSPIAPAPPRPASSAPPDGPAVAPPITAPFASPVTPPAAPPIAPPIAPAFHVTETMPPPPENERRKDRSTLPWKDTQLGQRPGRGDAAALLRVAPRSIPLGTTIVVSAITATVVVLAVLYAVLRSPSPAVSTANTAKATAVVTSARRSPPAPSSPAPQAAPSAPAAASAAPSVSAAPAATAAPTLPDAAELPLGFGYLIATYPTPADVYISGKSIGPANEPLKVRCGRFFVRLGVAGGGKFPEWVSLGQTVNIACQGSTTAAFKAGSAPKR